MVLSTDVKVNKCEKHANKTITTVCLNSTCKNSFMCFECIKEHDKNHFDNCHSIADIEGDESFIAEVKSRRKSIVEDFAKVFVNQEKEMQTAKEHIQTSCDEIAEALAQKKKALLNELSAHFLCTADKNKEATPESLSQRESSTELSTEDEAFSSRMHQLIDFNFEPEQIMKALMNMVEFNKIEAESKELVSKCQKRITENTILKERVELYKRECLKVIGEANIEQFKTGRKFDFESEFALDPEEIAEKDRQIEELTAAKRETQTEIERVYGSLQTLTTQKNEMQTQLNQANERLAILTTQKNEIQTQLNQANTNLTSMTTQKNNIQTELNQANTNLNQKTTQNTQFQTTITNLTNTNTGLQNQVTNLNAELTNLRNSQSSLSSTISSLQSQLSNSSGKRSCGIVGKSGNYDVYFCNGKQSGCTSPSGTVWGTNIYTSDSSKCRAGLHSGVLGQMGGIAYIENLPGQSSYSGTVQNGESTNSYGNWGGSFQFRSIVNF